MKKPHQIEAQRAVRQFEAMAENGNPAVQLVLPMIEAVGTPSTNNWGWSREVPFSYWGEFKGKGTR